MIIFVRRGIAALSFIFALSGIASGLSASDRAFGETTTYQSDDKFNLTLDVTSDKKAFTLVFADLGVQTSTPDAPIATRVFSFTLPLEGGDKDVEIPVFVSGWCTASEGAIATLMFSVNGETTITHCASGKEDEKDYVQELHYIAGSASEARMVIFLLVERDSKYPDAQAQLKVHQIDSNLWDKKP